MNRLSIVCLLLPIAAPALAGIEVDRRLTGGRDDDPQILSVREDYDSRHQRVDVLSADGKSTTSRLSLYDADRGEIYLFDDKARKYTVTTRESFAAITDRSGASQASKPTPADFKRVGTKKTGPWKCTRHQVRRDGKTLGEVCTVPLSTFRLEPKDLGTYANAAELAWSGTADSSDWMYDTRYGFPVEVVSEKTRSGPRLHAEVLAVRKIAFDPEHFALPKGYEKSEPPALPGAVNVPSGNGSPARPR